MITYSVFPNSRTCIIFLVFFALLFIGFVGQTLGENLDSANLLISQGFRVLGESTSALTGISVSAAGDVNGDGKADFVIGALAYSSGAGRAYLIYGGNSLSNIDLTTLTSSQGLTFTGSNAENVGNTVRSAGDFNGDGKADILIGAPDYSTQTGRAYLIFGSSSMSSITLSALASSQGIKITCGEIYDKCGHALSSAGDVNGDGKNDILIGAFAYLSQSYKGIVYLLFGKSSLSDINLGSLTTTQGISILGANNNDWTGSAVSGIGDVNSDGKDDFLIAAIAYPSNAFKGIVYLIYGKVFTSNIDLSTGLGGQGVIIIGENNGDRFGSAVSSAGDINADGKPDFIIGAHGYSSSKGKVYIIYGSSTLPSSINAGTLGSYGITITGASSGHDLGISVSNIGDINLDGRDDVILGASGYDSSTGRSYLIYGSNSLTNIDLSNLNDACDTITGPGTGYLFGFATSGAGDVNGDGKPDFLVGMGEASGKIGRAYLIYGSPTGFVISAPTAAPTPPSPAININQMSLTPYQGINIVSESNYADTAYSVSGVGDINGDGKDDIVIGAPNDSPSSGKAYVIYGGSNLGNIALSSLTTSQGIYLYGVGSNFFTGFSVSGAGDFNGDGYDDILVGAKGFSSGPIGRAYIVYGGGSLSHVTLSSMPSTQGATIIGQVATDLAGYSVGRAGDFNGDGKDDIIFGAPMF
jgi:hypothetical protein